MRMYIKRFICAMFFACVAPITAFGVMAYTPSKPCCYQQCNEEYYEDTEYDNDWYVSFFVSGNMWSWDNSYKSDYAGVVSSFDSDKYSFKSVLGGAVALGTTFSPELRGEIELGMSSKFTDADELVEFSMSLPYAMLNLYRDFEGGFYLGAGVGLARNTVNLDGAFFDNKGSRKSLLSPKAGLSIGYTTSVSDGVYIDFRYRSSWVKGAEVSNSTFLWDQYVGSYDEYSLEVKSSWVWENAVFAGLRFNF